MVAPVEHGSNTNPVVLGRGVLVQSPAGAGLIDEYVLVIGPVVLGEGQRFVPRRREHVVAAGCGGSAPRILSFVLHHEELERLYGPWRARSPLDAAALLDGYGGRWWVAGGWAIDAFTGTGRTHADLDIGIPRVDAGIFTEFVATTLDVWAAAGSLTPLLRGGALSISPDCGNLWLRASGADPWDYDVLLDDVRGRTWFYKRAADIFRPLDDCVWSRDGITYLRPEIQLLFKAEHAREKDTVDFERCLPRLDDRSRTWLAQSLFQRNSRHPWIGRLASDSQPAQRLSPSV